MDNTEKKRIKILNYRTDQGIAPKPADIVHGEIAIGYKKGSEAIYIKNSANEIVDFTSTSIISLTYRDLRNLRRSSKLKPSQYYRITDFVTTVANDPEAQSAGHPFDIIILATDKRKLQEECYAIRHEGDKYFANSNLAAWKIWYCLDNDHTKYAWADRKDGKGVIYRMIDEWGNDCPYDFKNVQFKRYRVTVPEDSLLKDLDGTYIGYNGEMNGLSITDTEDFVWAYTFSFGNRQDPMTPNDASIIGYNNSAYSANGYYGDNSIKPTSKIMTVDNSTFSVFCLNNIVWQTDNDGYHRSLINGNRIESSCFNMTLSGNGTIIGHDCQNFIMGDGCFGNVFGAGSALNTFGNDCHYNTFGPTCSTNQFGNNCIYNTFEGGCNSNTFGDGCNNNTFENACYANTFGNKCGGNQFGNGCGSNTFGSESMINQFGNDCSSNTFGNGCNNNTFENKCYSNTFGDACVNNTFGNECQNNVFNARCTYNQFGNGCNNNPFGNDCNNNTFGNTCVNNTFGTTCSSNHFGNFCVNNQFGNDCSSNTFENNCTYNQFGIGCSYNHFGNGCHYNTFENNCTNNQFGNGCTYSTFGNYFTYNALGNDVQYIEITTEKIYHTQILNGTKGTSDSKKLTIPFNPEKPYSQFAGLTSRLGLDGKNELKTWVLANNSQVTG